MRQLKEHSCLRGEHLRKICSMIVMIGSPLLTRGALELKTYQNIYKRITPAHAGSTCNFCTHSKVSKDHPCLRGEYLSLSKNAHQRAGSPLLTRGAHIFNKLKKRCIRISPACAGSTSATTLKSSSP